jgi:hypothetical protein
MRQEDYWQRGWVVQAWDGITDHGTQSAWVGMGVYVNVRAWEMKKPAPRSR